MNEIQCNSHPDKKKKISQIDIASISLHRTEEKQGKYVEKINFLQENYCVCDMKRSERNALLY